MAGLRYPLRERDEGTESQFVQFQSISEGGSPSKDSIVLYAPVAISLPGSVQYSNFDQSGLNYLLSSEGGRNGELSSAFTAAGFGGVWENIFGSISKENSSAMVTMAIGNAVGLGDITSFNNRRAFNPNTKALFRGVDIRTFTFSFTFIPISEAEANVVNRIIAQFRESLYPEAEGAFFYKFPDKFNVIIHSGQTSFGNDPGAGMSATASSLIKTKPSYLTNVNVVYNPNLSAWHKDGNPVETQLELTFQEGETLTAEDIRGGF